jgi:hypothetical protein
VPDEDDKDRWLHEIERTMLDLEAEGYAEPCPANAVFFTNDPSHYLMAERVGRNADRLWIRHYIPEHPRMPNPETDMVARILKAHKQRVSPPERFSGTD